MVEKSKYVIVPNNSTGDNTNAAGDSVAELIERDWRVLHKVSTKESVHYVLAKFRGNRRSGGPRRPGNDIPFGGVDDSEDIERAASL